MNSVLGLAVGRFIYIQRLLSAHDDGIASNETIIMQEIEMIASVSTNIIIALRPFTKDLNTNFGQGGGAIVAYGMSKAQESSAGGGGMKSFSESNGGGIGSKIASRLRLSRKGSSFTGNSGLKSWGTEKPGADGVDLEDWRRSKQSKGDRTIVESSESVKDLTRDVITQTTEFHVEYEDSSEGGRSRETERFHE